MTKKLYIAFYDDEEGGSRENWNTFYTPWVAAWTEADARRLAQAAIDQEVIDEFKRQFGIDLTTVTDESTLAADAQEELNYLRQRAKDMHIEIQEGEIG
jgi:hypothetical protein